MLSPSTTMRGRRLSGAAAGGGVARALASAAGASFERRDSLHAATTRSAPANRAAPCPLDHERRRPAVDLCNSRTSMTM
jgi:hypothetical protein